MTLTKTIQKTAGNTEFNLLSQSLRLMGAGAGIALFILGSKGTSVLAQIALITPALRLPFHSTHAINKAIETADSSKSKSHRITTLLGSAFLGVLTLRTLLMLASPVAPVGTATTLLRASLPYIKATEMGISLYGLSNKSSWDGDDKLKLVNNSVELFGAFALIEITPIPFKSLIDNTTSFLVGGTTIWSLPNEAAAKQEQFM